MRKVVEKQKQGIVLIRVVDFFGYQDKHSLDTHSSLFEKASHPL